MERKKQEQRKAQHSESWKETTANWLLRHQRWTRIGHFCVGRSHFLNHTWGHEKQRRNGIAFIVRKNNLTSDVHDLNICPSFSRRTSGTILKFSTSLKENQRNYGMHLMKLLKINVKRDYQKWRKRRKHVMNKLW